MLPAPAENLPSASFRPPRWSSLFAAVFLGVLAGLAAWFLLMRLYPVLVVTAAGFALAYLFDPLLDRLEARGWSRGQAVGALAVVILLVLAVAGLIVVPVLAGQVKTVVANWPAYSQEVQDLLSVEHLAPLLESHFPREQLIPYLEEQERNLQDWLATMVLKALGWASGAVVRSATWLGLVLLTLIIALYAAMILDPFRRALSSLFSARGAAALRTVDRKVTYMLSQYLRGVAVTCTGVALANALLLQVVGLFFGTQYSLLLGVYTGVAYMVPWIGMTSAVLLTGLLAYLTASQHVWVAVAVSVGTIVVVNQCFDSLIMPRIVGRKVGLHPLVIILALLAGGKLLGIWGMIIATPMAATLKIILAQWVPVVATVPDVPEDRQPLVLDLGGFLAQTWGTVRNAGQRLEEQLSKPFRGRDEEDPQ